MNCWKCWIVVGLVAVVPQTIGCQEKSTALTTHENPAFVTPIDGSEISRVTLSEAAMKRLDIQTSAVTENKSPRTESAQKAVPYSALIYDSRGNTWVYTSPNPRVFVRAPIDVDYIQDGTAFLSKGPEPGTNVATVGVAELYGTEFTVGH